MLNGRMSSQQNTNPANILSKFGNIVAKWKMINEKAQDVMHSLNYQGRKRMHRWYTQVFLYTLNCVRGVTIDKFEQMAEIEHISIAYAPNDLKTHLEMWIQTIKTDLEELKTLSVMFFNATGTNFKPMVKFIKCLYRQKEKAIRHHKRHTDCNWEAHDIYMLDMYLHEKYKEKEKDIKALKL